MYSQIDNTFSPYAAVAGHQIFANTSTSTITVTLPASPATGDEVTIIDSRNNFTSNAVTVDRNGKPINNAASNATLGTNGQAVTFVYIDGTCGWNYKTNTA